MNLLLKQKGIQIRLDPEDEDIAYYFTDDMLKNNVVIEDSFSFCEEHGAQSYITIRHYNDLDAFHYQLYWDEYLEPILRYKVILNIFDLYQEFPLQMFIDITKEMSGSGYSASMQTKPGQKKKVMQEIKKTFRDIKKAHSV